MIRALEAFFIHSFYWVTLVMHPLCSGLLLFSCSPHHSRIPFEASTIHKEEAGHMQEYTNDFSPIKSRPPSRASAKLQACVCVNLADPRSVCHVKFPLPQRTSSVGILQTSCYSRVGVTPHPCEALVYCRTAPVALPGAWLYGNW